MKIFQQDKRYILEKEGTAIGWCGVEPRGQEQQLTGLWVEARWRRRGYGSYLLKETLRATGGYVPGAGSLHTAPLPEDPAETAFWQKFGFVPQGGRLVRRRPPELTAVAFAQSFLADRLPKGGFAVDATCGNGHDTEFLCRAVGPEGRVLALDIQPAAVESTRRRLAEKGWENARVVCADHASLAALAAPESADCVMFNFGWLPGADHSVYSGAGSSIPALKAALELLRPGGVLSAVLYSGKVIGDSEKQAVLEWAQALPLSRYTVLVCRFANWADTAPLPCLILKK